MDREKHLSLLRLNLEIKHSIDTHLKDGLALNALIPTIILGAVTAVAIGELAEYIRSSWKNKK